MPNYSTNTVTQQARNAAKRLWDLDAAPDLLQPLARKPEKAANAKLPSKQQKGHTLSLQRPSVKVVVPQPAVTQPAVAASVFPVLPSVPPHGRTVPRRQSTTAILANKISHQQKQQQQQQQQRPQGLSGRFSPTLRAPSPPSPRADVKERRPFSANASPRFGVRPDEPRLTIDVERMASETSSGSGGPSFPPQHRHGSPSSPLREHHATDRGQSQQPGLSSLGHDVSPGSDGTHLARSTRASGSARHILTRSFRLRTEGTTLEAHCSAAPSVWGAAALARDLVHH